MKTITVELDGMFSPLAPPKFAAAFALVRVDKENARLWFRLKKKSESSDQVSLNDLKDHHAIGDVLWESVSTSPWLVTYGGIDDGVNPFCWIDIKVIAGRWTIMVDDDMAPWVASVRTMEPTALPKSHSATEAELDDALKLLAEHHTPR